MTKRLYVDLSPQEEADIHGWVNYYAANLSLADHPVRIVLSDRTRARYDQIAAQFSQPSLEVVVVQEFRDGDPRFVFTSTDSHITAIPFTVAPPPYPQTSMFSASAAEYGVGGTGLARASVSRTAGDMVGLGWVISGSNATIDLDALVVGHGQFFFNHHMLPGHGPRGSGFSANLTR